MVSPYSYVGMKCVIGNNFGLPTEKQDEIANDIIVSVCNFYGVPIAKVTSERRIEPYVTIRHICMYFIKEKTNMTFKRIGELFGGRDHSTIIVAIRKIEGQVNAKFDNDIKDDVKKLKMII